MTTDQKAYIEGLHDLANFLENHPEFIVNYSACSIYVFAGDLDEFGSLCRDLGAGTKSADTAFLELRKEFGPHALTVNIHKDDSCEKVQVGTERKIVSIPSDAVRSDEGDFWVVETPVFEWKCPPSFLSQASA